MFVAATVLLFWNEGRAVKTAKAIEEAESVATHVEDVSNIDPSLAGKLIHASAFAQSHDTLYDDIFGAKVGGIKLKRKVEYYQWKEQSKEETREKFGGGTETITTYTYRQDWVNSPISSANFHDPEYQSSNFVIADIEETDQMASDVTFGAYRLPEFVIGSISGDIPVELNMDEERTNAMNMQLAKNLQAMNRLPPTYLSDTTTVAPVQLVSVRKNVVYIGKSPNVPQVGDVRVTITAVPSCDISLIAKVNGSTFDKYIAKNGRNFSRVEVGTVSMENMFQGAKNDNSTLTWIFRIIGVLLVISGLKSMFDFLSMLLKWFPALGNLIEAGVGLVCGILGFVWSLIIIAIAWLFYRPIIGIPILVIAGGAIFYLRKRAKEKHNLAAATAAAQPQPEQPAQPVPPTPEQPQA